MNEIARWVMIGILIIGVIAIGYIFIINIPIPIPSWFIQIFWVILLVVICVGAIQLILKMSNKAS